MSGANPSSRRSGLAPVTDAATTLLILGSLPGERSLAEGRYYAHPQNGFWRLIGGVIGADLPALPYDQRLERLKSAGVGLWDVIASAERPGSLDAAIRDAVPTDLNQLIDGLPSLRAVAFNGGTAARLGRRLLSARAGIALIDLPSSSPAHARPLAEKAAAWATLSQALTRN